MVNVYALCGGLIDLDRSGFFSDVAPGTRVTVPVICFLLAHPSGHVLVDTGVHRQAISDPVGRLGERRAGLFRLRSTPTDEVVSQLALLGLAPDDIRYVVNSHFHFDHCGGNEFFPHATFLVQRPEMEAARQVLAAPRCATARAPSISTIRWTTGWWMASTTSSATVRSCSCRPTGIRRAISPSGCGPARALISC